MRSSMRSGDAWVPARNVYHVRMRRALTTTLIVLVTLASQLSWAQTPSLATVRGLAPDAAGESLAVWIDAGVLLRGGDGSYSFLCAAAWRAEGAEAEWVAQTAPGRPVIAGAQGPFMALEHGCEWARISGAADSAHVAGMHAPEPGGLTLYFALTSEFGPDELVRTTDGGFTSSNVGGFSQLDKTLTGVVGEGEALVVSGIRTVSQTGILWRSLDAGQTFEELETDGDVSGDLAGMGNQIVWLAKGTSLNAVDVLTGEAVAEVSLDDAPRSMAVTPEGVVWWVASDGGVRNHDPLTDEGSSFDVSATEVVSHDDSILLGVSADLPGDPLVLKLSSDEESWEVLAELPSVWSYPEGCETLMAQTCSEDEALLVNLDETADDPGPSTASEANSGCASGPGTSGIPLELCIFFLWMLRKARGGVWAWNETRPASP